jgi:hypothetical protein
MSQSKYLQEEYSKKYLKAANNAAINSAITDLVAARNVRHADGGKRLIKSSNSYKNVIASLQSVGVVDITYDALMKRAARASVEDSIAEIRSTNTSTESVVSSLSLSSPCEQAGDDSLTSEKTAETTSHNDQSLGTPELKSGVGGRPKGSTKAKIKKDKETESKCTDAITFEYSRQHNTAKSVGEKVEYGYLKRLIEEKKKLLGMAAIGGISPDMLERNGVKGGVNEDDDEYGW